MTRTFSRISIFIWFRCRDILYVCPHASKDDTPSRLFSDIHKVCPYAFITNQQKVRVSPCSSVVKKFRVSPCSSVVKKFRVNPCSSVVKKFRVSPCSSVVKKQCKAVVKKQCKAAGKLSRFFMVFGSVKEVWPQIEGRDFEVWEEKSWRLRREICGQTNRYFKPIDNQSVRKPPKIWWFCQNFS